MSSAWATYARRRALRYAQEADGRADRGIRPGNDSKIVDACDTGTIALRWIEWGEYTLRGPYEAMVDPVRVCVYPDHEAARVQAADESGGASRGIERSDRAILGAHKTVEYLACVLVIPGNCATPIDRHGDSVYAAGRVERGKSPLWRAHVAVQVERTGAISSRDRSRKVD